MDNMFILMDVLVIGCGVYVIYAYYLLKTKGELKEKLLLSDDIKFNKCKDKPGYINYMSPRLLIFGIVCILCGAIGVLNDYTQFMGMGYVAVMVTFLAIVIWFAIIVKKSVKMFW